jgi:5'(3')-deoxyribonucleotidase
MRIGIDVDGVLSDTLVAIQRKFPGWDTSKGWYGGFTKEQFDAVWEDAKNELNFWYTIPAVSGIDYEAFRELNRQHDLYFITDRFNTAGESAIKQTTDWVNEYLGIHRAAGVIIAKDKGPAAAVLQLDAFIDDKPKNCLDVLYSVPGCETYLCTLPHNRSWTGTVPRVANFNEFAQIMLKGTRS